MSPKAIVEFWGVTEDIFIKHNILLTRQTLESLVDEEQLSLPLQELNAAVGSSNATCIKGG
ncbi:hypothetical protein [Neobacillus sp. OS1-33]|uniref:hypothetical protein n=1 Tax=Neobacillus sp. OS1-33 TaxID=3070683 RepID=UPI0027E1C04A|nr:hypothetical protein [Neobacillus sp. OS1-33]WML26827.1 hypothetical protein RCG22_04090 [Neobacillus sp. OS1-33]